MPELYKRRLRIVGNAGELRGYMLTVQDADTDEHIPGVHAATIHLTASGLNTAHLTYYEMDDEGKPVLVDGEPVIKIMTVQCPLVDVTVMERLSPLEQLIGQALIQASQSKRDGKKLIALGEQLTQAIVALLGEG